VKCESCSAQVHPQDGYCKACGRIRNVDRFSMKPLALLLAAIAVVGTVGFLGYFAYARKMREVSQSPGVMRSELTVIQVIAEKYYADHHECPTMERLRDEKEISSTTRMLDTWDGYILISCDDNGVRATSMGPNGSLGTADDIHVPE
jgi:hypothetical protein